MTDTQKMYEDADQVLIFIRNVLKLSPDEAAEVLSVVVAAIVTGCANFDYKSAAVKHAHFVHATSESIVHMIDNCEERAH
jgi:hypothetical protein